MTDPIPPTTLVESSSPDGASDLGDLGDRIVAHAAPGEQIEVYLARGETTSVKAYGGEVESLTSARSQGVGIRVVVSGRQGFAHAGTLDEDVIAETLAEARDNASFGEVDEFFGLAEPDGVPVVEQDLWSEALVAFPTAAKVDLALALERAVVGLDPRVTGVRTASYGDGRGEAAVVTSTGIRVWGRSAVCSLSVQALAVSGDETKLGVGLAVGRDPADLDQEAAAADAVERAVRMFGARPAPSERLAVVFEPRLAATLMALAGGTLTGERVLKGRSPFANRQGEPIASPLVTLVDDPTDRRSMAADTHDGEGLACRRNVLIEAGTLRGFLHNSYTGRRSGTASTGSAVRGYRSTPGVGCQALAVAPGNGTHHEVISALDRGFYVQSLSGLHSGVNPVSGDVSVGAEGLMIRSGDLAEPVREVTLASTLPRMLLDVVAVGADLEWLPGGTAAATMVVDGIQLSGA